MKRTNKTKYWASFCAGILATLLVSSLAGPALAAGANKVIQVFTGVSIYINDSRLDPRDANGNPVEPFIYNGTTYLPVRAISSALGIPIQWEGSSRSVYVGSHKSDTPAAWLAQMDYFSGTEDSDFYTETSDQDNTGGNHTHCITLEFDRTYILNGQYTQFTGTLYQRYQYRSESARCSFHVYGDGQLLYTYSYDDEGMKPVDFNVDLTGVLELRVEFSSSGGWYTSDCALGDAALWT